MVTVTEHTRQLTNRCEAREVTSSEFPHYEIFDVLDELEGTISQGIHFPYNHTNLTVIKYNVSVDGSHYIAGQVVAKDKEFILKDYYVLSDGTVFFSYNTSQFSDKKQRVRKKLLNLGLFHETQLPEKVDFDMTVTLLSQQLNRNEKFKPKIVPLRDPT